MNTEETAIVVSSRAIPTFELNSPIVAAKEKALSTSALIGRVTGHDSKVLAVRAQQELKTLSAMVEKARKAAKEPLLVAGRQLDAICGAFVLDLDKEFGRIAASVQEFDMVERRRVAEEERLQQVELARIQREKDAEIERLRQEQLAKEAQARRIQAEADEKAAKLQQEADKLAAEATNAKQRRIAQEASEAAERSRVAAEEEKRQAEAKAAQERAELAARTSAIEEKASDASYVASKPVEITKVAGQINRPTWEIQSINIWVLSKARPDLVTNIEFDKRAINAELAKGTKLPGVIAKEVYKADVRAGRMPEALDV